MQVVNPVAQDTLEPDLAETVSLQPQLPVGLSWSHVGSLLGKYSAAQWTGFFVALGIVARLTRFLVAFPLTPDEYQLAANLLDRDFLALLRPLEFNQVAPIGFLWIEAAAMRLLGFSELSLRLFPCVCGIASLWLYRQLAGRLLQGLPLVLAVAIFAVAYYPIRYSAEVKPYSCDALCSLLLFSLAVEWWQAPGKTRWLWWLVGLAPLTLAFSFPAAFVCGGVSLGILLTLWQRRRNTTMWPARIAWVAFNLAVAIAFLGLMRLNISAQYNKTQHDMVECWATCFPPWEHPWQLPGWLLLVHTSEMFAYPIGAENGGSLLSSICFGMALWSAIRRPRCEVAVAVVACFGLSLVAAALHRYPYGGHARLSQYLAPAICLLTGAGAALLITKLRSAKWQLATVRLALLACAIIGTSTAIRDCFKPYKDRTDRDHREFARRFWNSAPQAKTVCLMTDLGLKAYKGSFVTAYLCNQRIYSAVHHDGGHRLSEQDAAGNKPVRCVAFHSASARKDDAVFAAWMHSMLSRYELTGTETHEIPLAKSRQQRDFDYYMMCYDVYYFEPRVKVAKAPASAQ